ncbi:MAG: GNAT family N-acetyltransferase, partial [Vicinamibacterales bacterium]
LWGFVTVPAWRGQGIYSALLQAILCGEAADRFWIGHDIGNTASARGILKAGFTSVGAAVQCADGVLRYRRASDDERSRAAQALLGMPGLDEH